MASVDAVTIANLALSHLGARSSIESLTESSPHAKQANLWYHFAREQALAANDWNFARKRLALAVHADDAPLEWTFRYQYPSDCIAARFVENPLGAAALPVPYQIEVSDDGTTKSVLTDTDDAVLIYTFDQNLTALFSPFFVLMLSYLLAAYMAFSVTGKRTLADSMFQLFGLMSLQAPAVEYNESMQREQRDPDHISGRNG